MNPLAKAVGTLLVLAAGTLGTTLEHNLLGDLPLPMQRTSEGDATGNQTGNQTSDGNTTTGGPGGSGNATDNQTAGGNETADGDGNETADADGNETAGDGSDGNETADPDDGAEDTSVCDFAVDEWGDDLTPQHHEWEWLVTRDVTGLTVEFQAYGGLPALGGHPEARLVDGSGRTLARTTGDDSTISLSLERGTDYLASGDWRLVYDSSDVWSDFYASIHLTCGGA
jgi:hypothetical protein